MKITKQHIISSGITLVAVAFAGYYIYQNRPVDLQEQINQNNRVLQNTPTQNQEDDGNGIIGGIQNMPDGQEGGGAPMEMPFDINEKLEDKRVQITDQKKKMYNSSVMLNLKANEQMYGTSYVAGKDTLITNKHVVYGYDKNPGAMEARVGHLDKNGKFTYTTFEVEKVTLPKKEELDVAVVHVKPLADGTHIGELRTPVTFGDSTKIKVGEKISIIGYPGDKPFGSLWDSTGTVAGNQSPLFLKALTKEGNSGSPIFNEKGEVVAILNAGGENISFGFPIDSEILKFFKANIK